MNFPFYIARRYLFAKKSHNLINIISTISVVGMAVGVTALIVVLSVFNGFDQLIRKMFSNIDSDLRIELVEGKTFPDTLAELNAVRSYPGVAVFSEVLQEHALFKYRNKQHIGVIKGVSRNYPELSGVDSMIIDGQFQLWRGSQPLAIMGQGVAYYLNANLAHFDPIEIYIPKRGRQFSISSANAFNSKLIMPSGVFAIEQEFDSQFIIVPIEFARIVTNFSTEVTSVEILLKPEVNKSKAQAEIQKILGEKFKVLNRYQQNESLYRTMNTEKLSIGVILSLILFIASFNIIGSLSMLIIDKRKDVETLRSLGANNDLIQKIFLTEGLLISFGGTILGTALGLLICWLQIQFKLVKLTGAGGFIVDAYPVDIQIPDIAAIMVVVLTIGYLTARFPVRIITKRIFAQENVT
ncbi:MAG TPA: ABC transporter permease [Tenuifilaceae bacterium]|nr:ABC transporter permease [Tenuifilaceae bacterium]HPE17434.1 ABC transporter permease [Tenuifilaceae bacterium]HPJ45617.1 ABC transporter permease [Tenuifilaceae bacterium]HPQ33487.1 ABC transporter permease [Tenuifilaceae bacterium]HRX66980.1 ABC transporter permease [Tenuifilaceae bacterium]